MPRENVEKTKLVRKYSALNFFHSWLGLSVKLLIISLLWYGYLSCLSGNEPGIVRGQIGGQSFRLSLADTDETRAKGLSGKDGLAAGTGMLFSFDSTGKHCFWMKEMKFAIDILWFDAGGRLIYIAPNIAPETYPKSYCPPREAKHVVELPAGSTMTRSITLGDLLILEKR